MAFSPGPRFKGSTRDRELTWRGTCYVDYFNRKGLATEHGEKKKAFFVLQKLYQKAQSAQTH
jgi:hypothetical protein